MGAYIRDSPQAVIASIRFVVLMTSCFSLLTIIVIIILRRYYKIRIVRLLLQILIFELIYTFSMVFTAFNLTEISNNTCQIQGFLITSTDFLIMMSLFWLNINILRAFYGKSFKISFTTDLLVILCSFIVMDILQIEALVMNGYWDFGWSYDGNIMIFYCILKDQLLAFDFWQRFKLSSDVIYTQAYLLISACFLITTIISFIKMFLLLRRSYLINKEFRDMSNSAKSSIKIFIGLQISFLYTLKYLFYYGLVMLQEELENKPTTLGWDITYQIAWILVDAFWGIILTLFAAFNLKNRQQYIEESLDYRMYDETMTSSENVSNICSVLLLTNQHSKQNLDSQREGQNRASSIPRKSSSWLDKKNVSVDIQNDYKKPT